MTEAEETRFDIDSFETQLRMMPAISPPQPATGTTAPPTLATVSIISSVSFSLPSPLSVDRAGINW